MSQLLFNLKPSFISVYDLEPKGLLFSTTRCSNSSFHLLDADLIRVPQDDLRDATIGLDATRHADALTSVPQFGTPELRSIGAPDQRGEDLLGVRFVEIKKRRLPPASGRVLRTCDDAAYGSCFADVIPCVGGRYGLGARGLRKDRAASQSRMTKCSSNWKSKRFDEAQKGSCIRPGFL